MHVLYALGSYLLFLALLPALLFHPKLRHGIPARLGFYRRSEGVGAGSPRIWLHGASAGDLLSLHPMMKELKARVPGCCIVVTTITNSGLEMARKKLAEADVVLYAPYDLPGATRRAVARLRPDLLVLEYTEIWPNLIRAARKAGVRIALTNGRFNPEKMTSYRTLFRLIRASSLASAEAGVVQGSRGFAVPVPVILDVGGSATTLKGGAGFPISCVTSTHPGQDREF